MLLTIDVGNTQTTLGLFDDTGLVRRQWRMATDTRDTTDQLHERLFGYFTMMSEPLSCVSHVAVSCVVPILSTRWRDVSERVFNVAPFLIDASRNCGITADVPFPSQVGADRIANAVAAKELYGAPVIVVDFGTATNIDVVDARGSFRGGAIMPGFMLSAQSLFAQAAKLSSVPLVVPERALGTTTEEAVQSGIVLGAATQIEGLVARIKKELDIPYAPVIATGGASATVAQATDIFDVINADLTLTGIWHIWNNAVTRHNERMAAQKSTQ